MSDKHYLVTVQALTTRPDGGSIDTCQVRFESELGARLFCAWANKQPQTRAVWLESNFPGGGSEAQQRMALALLQRFVDHELNYEGRG